MEQTLLTETNEKPTHTKVSTIMAMLSISMVVIFIGLVKFGISMYGTFQEVRLDGVGDPKVMAGQISSALVHYVYYLFFAVPGWFLAMSVLLFTNYRSKKYFKFLIVIAVTMTIVFPFSTILGLILAITLFVKRKQFKQLPNVT